MTKKQKKELRKYTPGTPAYVYFHGCYYSEVGLSPCAKLDPKYGGYSGILAFKIASLLRGDEKQEKPTLFNRELIPGNSRFTCRCCVHRQVWIGKDCGIEGDQAKAYFKFPLKEVLPTKIAHKQIAHFCPFLKRDNI